MLIYDGDCGFCEKVITWLRGQLTTPVTIVPWQDVYDLGELGLTVDDVSTAIYWVDTYGRRARGHRAAAKVLRLCRQPLPLAGVLLDLPPISWLAAVVYPLIARNRHRMPGATAACKLPRKVTYHYSGDGTPEPVG